MKIKIFLATCLENSSYQILNVAAENYNILMHDDFQIMLKNNLQHQYVTRVNQTTYKYARSTYFSIHPFFKNTCTQYILLSTSQVFVWATKVSMINFIF